jgi:hypothetical protein
LQAPRSAFSKSNAKPRPVGARSACLGVKIRGFATRPKPKLRKYVFVKFYFIRLELLLTFQLYAFRQKLPSLFFEKTELDGNGNSARLEQMLKIASQVVVLAVVVVGDAVGAC